MFFSIKDVVLNLFSRKIRRVPWDFNSAFYQYLYDDVDKSGKSARRHYRDIGKKEGRIYKKSVFLKKMLLDTQRETIVFCCDDERQSLFFIEAIKKLSNNFNIVVIVNSYHSSEAYLPFCQWLIVNKTFDRAKSFAASLINKLATLPNLKFVISNICESGFFYKQLEKRKIASVLLIDHALAFSKSDLSRGLRSATRVVYTNETYAEKVLYDYMYGYPDQVTIWNSAIQEVDFSASESDKQYIIGYGDISFADGFDIFAQVANLYKKQYPNEKVEFAWLQSLNNGDRSDPFDQNQSWMQVCQDNQSFRVINKQKNIDDYYKKAAVFCDTSRFASKISHVRAAFQAGKAVFGMQGIMPLSSIYNKHKLADHYLFAASDSYKLVEKLHDYVMSSSNVNDHQFVNLANEIGSIDQFVEDLLTVGNEAANQIKQEAVDAIELLDKKEFDYKFWVGDRVKIFTQNNARQYIRSWKSGVYPRRPCAGFQPGIYAEYHDLGIERKDPFLHYINAGQPDGPWKWEILTKPIKIEPAALNQKIALQIHAYYIEKLEIMLNALLANQVRPDLFVSVKDEIGKNIAENLLKDYPAKVEILIAPNRGRDIGPLLTLFREQLRHGYDIIGHMHSKTSVHINDRSYAEIWGQYLTINLLGDGKSINAADTIIQAIYNDKDINLVFPDDKNGISWAKNHPAAQKLAPQLGIEKLPNYINFPVGTMFWATNDLMKPFFDLELDWNDYLSEPLPLDGTNLHAIERLFGVMNEKMSKKLVCTMFGNIKR